MASSSIMENSSTHASYYIPNIAHPTWANRLTIGQVQLLSNTPVGDMVGVDVRQEWNSAVRTASSSREYHLKRDNFYAWRVFIIGLLQSFRAGRGLALLQNSILGSPTGYRWLYGEEGDNDRKATLADPVYAESMYKLDDMSLGTLIMASITPECSQYVHEDLSVVAGVSGVQAWTKLNRAFVQQGQGASATIRQQLQSYRMGTLPAQSVADDLRQLFLRHHQAGGERLSDNAKINYLLDSLDNPVYHDFRKTILREMNRGKVLTFDGVAQDLLQEESMIDSSSNNPHTGQVTAFYGQTDTKGRTNRLYNQSHHNSGFGKPTIPSRFSNNSPKMPRRDSPYNGGKPQDNRGKCNKCGRRGHTESNCHDHGKPHSRPPNRVQFGEHMYVLQTETQPSDAAQESGSEPENEAPVDEGTTEAISAAVTWGHPDFVF